LDRNTLLVRTTLEIRAMQPDDWPAVREIYAQGIAGRMATFGAAVSAR
jgi:L-amino acid N-acyltransferase YncA